MSWSAEVEELERRRAFALQMGGEEGVARQHLNGKLTVRERLALFADPGSFREFTGLAGEGTYGESGELVHFRPKAAVEGMVKLDGHKVVVSAGDFTVRGGSGGGRGSGGMGTELPANQRALQWRLPFVRLLDAAGGEGIHTTVRAPGHRHARSRWFPAQRMGAAGRDGGARPGLVRGGGSACAAEKRPDCWLSFRGGPDSRTHRPGPPEGSSLCG